MHKAVLVTNQRHSTYQASHIALMSHRCSGLARRVRPAANINLTIITDKGYDHPRDCASTLN